MVIRRIIRLRNIGLLQDATQNGAVQLARVSAIYGENARGKSTLAAVMRACSAADAGRINARRTIDSANPPEICFLLSTGSNVEFTSNAWIGAVPEILVFDSEFVEQNVYSGFEVRTDQKQSLLEFALGNTTVQLKQRVDQLTGEIDTQTKARSQAEKTLIGYATPMPIAQFLAMQPVTNAQQQIDALQTRIAAARNAQSLISRKEPAPLQLINVDIPAVVALLEKQLADVERSADVLVKAHLAKHTGAGLEDWITRGQDFLALDQCPFCGQGLNDLELLQAYRSYFNKEYRKLKSDVAAIEAKIRADLADTRLELIKGAIETNAARVEAWKDQIDLAAPIIGIDALMTGLRRVREKLLGLIALKRQSPLEPSASQSEFDAIASAIAAINKPIAAYNVEIATLGQRISEYKRNLALEDVKSLQSQIKNLEAAQKRQQPDVIAAATSLQIAEAERSRLENAKSQARQQIDELMQSTLERYQHSINELLADFAAEFSIEELKPSYVGSGEARTEYALSIRKRAVKLGTREDLSSGCGFATTLSESDKRTLAFAFFVARLKADPNLAQKLVVLDDPVSSLDRNRRHQTIRLTAELAEACGQLIVLSHDSYFLRDLRERIARATPDLAPAFIEIKRAQNGYSAFGSCDIDDICSSDYYRHHRLVADYVDGKSPASVRDVAKAIRPMLEGYYHRRFPGRIPRRLLFGHIISMAQQAAPPDPLAFLHPVLTEMREVNDYASQFHHDANSICESGPVVDSELVVFARRALTLVYQNG